MVQYIPAVPTFGERLADKLTDVGGQLLQGYQKRKQNEKDEQIIGELMNPKQARSPIQQIVLASRLSPQTGTALSNFLAQKASGEQQAQTQLAVEKERGKQKILQEQEKGKIRTAETAQFAKLLGDEDTYNALIASLNVPQQPVDSGSPLNQSPISQPGTTAAPGELTPQATTDREGLPLGTETAAMPGLTGKQSFGEPAPQATSAKQQKTLGQKALPFVGHPTFGPWAKEIIANERASTAEEGKNIRAAALEESKKTKLSSQEALASYKLTDKFREELSNDFNNYKQEDARLARLEDLNKSDKLVKALPKKIMDSIGVPLSVWGNPQSEEYEKLVADMTKSARDYYGARITNFELDAFLKTLPSLLNSKEGRQRIINNLRILKEPQALRHAAFKDIMKEWKDAGNKGVPFDLREQIDARIEPRLNDLASQFASDRKFFDPETGKSYNIPFEEQKNIPKTWIREQ